MDGTTTTPWMPVVNAQNSTTPLSTGVLVCTSVSSILSILGAIVIFITYAIVEQAKNQTRRLLIYLTISDLMTCCGNLLGTIRYAIHYKDTNVELEDCLYSSEICVFQSFLTTFSSMASFFWTFFISLHLFLSVVYNSDWVILLQTKVLSHLLCWGVPLLITLTATFYGVLGEDYSIGSGAWCWIRGCLGHPYLMTLWMTVTGKGWEILTYISTCALYMYLKIYMFKERKRRGRQIGFKNLSDKLRNEDENFVFIWLVLYLLRIWGTVRYFIAVYNLHGTSRIPMFDDADRVLIYFQSIGDSGQAFWNCVIFCFLDETVKNGIKDKLCNRTVRTKQEENQNEQSESEEEREPLMRINVN